MYGLHWHVILIQILYKVLKAPSPLQYQLAFLSSVSVKSHLTIRTQISRSLIESFPTSQELREIYSGAPPPLPSQLSASKDPNSLKQPNNRKEISGDCPICFSEFEPESDEIVWCKAACGNNIHRTCFEQWAKSQKSQQQVRCVFWWVFSNSLFQPPPNTSARNNVTTVVVPNGKATKIQSVGSRKPVKSIPKAMWMLADNWGYLESGVC